MMPIVVIGEVECREDDLEEAEGAEGGRTQGAMNDKCISHTPNPPS